MGKKEKVLEEKEELIAKVKCDDVGPMLEYVGCKVEHNVEEQWLRLMQPVLIQSLKDELGVSGDSCPNTPAVAGASLQASMPGDEKVGPEKHSWYRSAVGKLLHAMRWSRGDLQNAVREVSRYMSGPDEKHCHAVQRLMDFVVCTPNRGNLLKPKGECDGKE